MKQVSRKANFYAVLSLVLSIMVLLVIWKADKKEDEFKQAMLSMVDKYIEDTKDMPVTIRCKKVAKACNYSYLRTGR